MVVQGPSQVEDDVRRSMSFVCDDVPTVRLGDSRVEGLPEVLALIGQRQCEEALVILAQGSPFSWARIVSLLGVESPPVAALASVMSINFRTGEVEGLMVAA